MTSTTVTPPALPPQQRLAVFEWLLELFSEQDGTAIAARNAGNEALALECDAKAHVLREAAWSMDPDHGMRALLAARPQGEQDPRVTLIDRALEGVGSLLPTNPPLELRSTSTEQDGSVLAEDEYGYKYRVRPLAVGGDGADGAGLPH